jgi:hypothetical protein
VERIVSRNRQTIEVGELTQRASVGNPLALPTLRGIRGKCFSDAEVEIYRHPQDAFCVSGSSRSTSRPPRLRCWRAASPVTMPKNFWRPAGGLTLRWRLQLANQPADIAGLHWIRRYRDFFDVIAPGAIERAKLKSGGPRRDARKRHPRLALWAAKSLNGKQRDYGWIIGHGLHLKYLARAQNSRSPVDADVER